MNKLPCVSIIIPSYNKGALILQTVASITANLYKKKIEIIIIDDSSTDTKTKAAYKKLAIIPCIQIKKNKGSGPSDARNYGLKLAQGEYIIFVDSDDLISSNFISESTNFLESQPANIAYVYPNIITFGRQLGLKKTPEFSAQSLKTFNYIPVTCLYRKKALQTIIGFRRQIIAMEDWDLFLQLLCMGYIGKKIPDDRDVYLFYRIIQGQGVNQSVSSIKKRYTNRTQILKFNKLYTPILLFWNIAAIAYAMLSPIWRIIELKAFNRISPALKIKIRKLLDETQ